MPPADRNNPKRSTASESQYTLFEFMRDFPDDKTCLQWLWNTRYAVDGGDKAYCPKDGEKTTFKRYETSQQRQSWTCTKCGHHIHPTAGTIFHKSSTSLHLWFYAMYLMSSTRCGISAKQLERELGVTYKTAWRIFHRIRNELMAQDDDPLTGEVEIDEMYVGGTRKDGKGRYPQRPKTPVLGMVERGGRVSAYVVEDKSALSLYPWIRKSVAQGTQLYTDEHPGYVALDKQGFVHNAVQHKDGIYVSGNVHTQTMDGFWSLVKNGIRGVYHRVSAKHLQGYLNEYVWRYNRRDDDAAMFLQLILRAARP
jgi:transposase-like protein